MSTIRAAVIGANGRMGSEAVRALEEADGIEFVAGITREDSIEDLLDENGQKRVDVLVDLTVPDATKQNVLWAVEHGIHVVVGVTGWTDESRADVTAALEKSPGTGVIIAPNFAIGAVLAMTFAQKAARFYESAEIIELHHPNKVDAPSGTAIHTAEAIARGREAAGRGQAPDATEKDPHGARGARIDGIPVHAVRLRGLTAHEEILFGNTGEQFTIRHDSFDRISFMPGIVLSVREVVDRPGLTVGLENILDLD
ncbi:4-hydroxy-tetrahydrodipicolinate reductase [Helcobacillus massiliensis]|uniref:4-hydroxy-tetrahydrodipicolinate reductase n=1 Tax=Helcobacillus massiliensis TaxID=521392 RepID=A0A839QWP3_9MICO|nr:MULTISPECIES: 4-hydroxy-tetrahydrodipicolinate reductase [Helcobacillus]MBB3021797.1 4-hydroxy-tetrahydrodipicolinate reductase [Helcobacillus massiliensis]MCG7427576.1 4-hydroxy-tetrahydrodipicolinate reductase [Helcobacillus sp. ACRRO]MCT1557873.1 4-hydroxy-tetrahydrodipicolinate reductase [Helcobacillus massiliensis]MCT2037358.1 4-hydroxy-tetrahydrodipicolinate reductase [Helcobacillus massiliensis]MCT2332102.1 4-hydroxy-tetrahydrodipicolinate reductase [Helcobacillus massiliensis]